MSFVDQASAVLHGARGGDMSGLAELAHDPRQRRSLETASSLIGVACMLTAVQRFGYMCDVRDITAFVHRVRAGSEEFAELLPPRETEAYLRGIVGEPELLPSIPEERGVVIAGVLFAVLTHELGMSDSDVAALIVQAGDWCRAAAGTADPEEIPVPTALLEFFAGQRLQ